MSAINNDTPTLLSFADYHDDILKNPTETVQFPLSDEDQQIIRNMIYSIQTEQLIKAGAPFKSAAGMAANQWGLNKRIFLYCPDGDAANQLEVVINPSYKPLCDADKFNPSIEDAWEGCFSIPLATGNIRRYSKIQVDYQDETGQHITRELTGWLARVWQHENDHLDGHLYDDPRTAKCLEKQQFLTLDELENFYKYLKR